MSLLEAGQALPPVARTSDLRTGSVARSIGECGGARASRMPLGASERNIPIPPRLNGLRLARACLPGSIRFSGLATRGPVPFLRQAIELSDLNANGG
jgi:hypothetical protein